MEQTVIKTDVLCIGGGIAGLMAAIRARELGASVVIAEKGHTLHSGKAGAGNDHFLCYIPEVHGASLEAFIQSAIMETQLAEGFHSMGRTRTRTYLGLSFDMVRLWDSWGIPMKYLGKWEFGGHAVPGQPLIHLRYEGKRQKAVLTEQALKRGAAVVNRVMVFDLFHGDGAFAALGIDTRQDKLVVFHARSVILGTGGVTRLYAESTPGWFANHSHPLALSGDGRIMAYRAGAELCDLEVLRVHCGPKYFARAGQGTWVGVVRDPQGRALGPFVTRPEGKYGDLTAEINKTIFADNARTGKGPTYMDCRGISEEDYDYFMHWTSHEGLDALFNHIKEEGADVRRNPVEFATYNWGSGGKIRVDDHGETAVPGLYAAGDEVGSNISHAAVFGRIAGEMAAGRARPADGAAELELAPEIEKRAGLFAGIRRRQEGPDFKEVTIALQQIMSDYAGSVRSESMLDAGISYLERLNEKATATIIARDAHELARCLEVFNLVEMGKLVMLAARERKETRGRHVRADHPMTNPFLNKTLTVKNVSGAPRFEWR